MEEASLLVENQKKWDARGEMPLNQIEKWRDGRNNFLTGWK